MAKVTGLFRRRGLALIPASRDARDAVGAMAEGDTRLFEQLNPRNMKQHRKFFALLGNVVEASGEWASVENLRRDLLLNTGRFDEVVDRFTGQVHKIPHSMAVASMTKAEFERLYDDCMKLLTEHFGCDPEMLLEEAE